MKKYRASLLIHARAVTAQNTLIIFEEIQECNDALSSLKYFNENAPKFAIASAGSLAKKKTAEADAPAVEVTLSGFKPETF